jgi:transposase
MGKIVTDYSSVTTVGLDLAKHVFFVHAVDDAGRVVAAKALRREDLVGFFAGLPRCLVGMEAQGPKNARELAGLIAAGDDLLPPLVRAALAPLVRQLGHLDDEIRLADEAIKAMAKADDSARRLMSIPGIGPVTASAIAASVQDVSSFSGPREFAAYLGLTPRQNSSGGKQRLGRVSKMGNRYLRKLLVVGAHAVLYNRNGHGDALRTWACKLMETKPFKLVAVAHH